MSESLEQTYQRLKRDCAESTKRTNKLLCEHDPMRNERFSDRKAKLQYTPRKSTKREKQTNSQ